MKLVALEYKFLKNTLNLIGSKKDMYLEPTF